MRKLWLTMLCALVFLGTATVSEAFIYVQISDGTTNPLVNGLVTPTKGGLVLRSAINAPTPNADTTTTLNILTCATRPCTVFFPSGAATQQAGDTFKIADVSSTNLARIEVLDANTAPDKETFKGVKFTSILPTGTSTYAAKTLTVTYGTQINDLRTLTSAQAASYSVSAAFSGSFKTSAGLKASACKTGTLSTDLDTLDDACARLSAILNGSAPVDGQGTTVSATIAVACNNNFPTLNPCGTGGSWTASTGTFTGVNDGRSLSCPSSCSPVPTYTLTGKFNGVNETLSLTASLNGVMANVTDQDGGVEDAALALAGEVDLNRWVTTSANSEKCKAVPKAPSTNDTRNITNKSSLPISFEYWCGQYSAAGPGGIPLVSLADTLLIPGAAGAKYMASRETFLPNPPGPTGLLFKQISSLTLTYQVVEGQEQSPDTRQGLITYSPCHDNAIRLEIQLVDSSGVDKGTLKVRLGKNSPFTDGCADFDGFVDIRNNQDPRVDPSGILINNPPSCCVTFGSLQNGTIGNLFVRKIAFIVGRPEGGDTDENFKVMFVTGDVNGIPPSLQEVTNLVRVTPTSTTGVSITITKLTSPSIPPQPTGVVKIIPSSQISIIGGKFTASVSINDIQPESQASYAISLCPNGVETGFTPDPPNLNPVLGICIADNARMTLQ